MCSAFSWMGFVLAEIVPISGNRDPIPNARRIHRSRLLGWVAVAFCCVWRSVNCSPTPRPAFIPILYLSSRNTIENDAISLSMNHTRTVACKMAIHQVCCLSLLAAFPVHISAFVSLFLLLSAPQWLVSLFLRDVMMAPFPWKMRLSIAEAKNLGVHLRGTVRWYCYSKSRSKHFAMLPSL